jgi:uncharacterized protein
MNIIGGIIFFRDSLMIVHISEILKEPGLEKAFHFKGPLDLEFVSLAGDMEITFKLSNAGSRVIVSGRVKAPVFLNCSRCLSRIREEIEISVQEQFLPSDSPELEAEILDWESVSLFPFSNDVIELNEVIRQNVLASIPIKPLCRQDCQGLAYKDAGEEEDVGAKPGIDSRLLPLLQIKSRAEGK